MSWLRSRPSTSRSTRQSLNGYQDDDSHLNTAALSGVHTIDSSLLSSHTPPAAEPRRPRRLIEEPRRPDKSAAGVRRSSAISNTSSGSGSTVGLCGQVATNNSSTTRRPASITTRRPSNNNTKHTTASSSISISACAATDERDAPQSSQSGSRHSRESSDLSRYSNNEDNNNPHRLPPIQFSSNSSYSSNSTTIATSTDIETRTLLEKQAKSFREALRDAKAESEYWRAQVTELKKRLETQQHTHAGQLQVSSQSICYCCSIDECRPTISCSSYVSKHSHSSVQHAYYAAHI
jgi:hypothetical protein